MLELLFATLAVAVAFWLTPQKKDIQCDLHFVPFLVTGGISGVTVTDTASVCS